MIYKNIKQALALPSVIRKYAERMDIKLHIQHVRILYALKIIDWPSSRLALMKFLSVRGMSMNYTQLNKLMAFMLEEQLIVQYPGKVKKYGLIARGLETLVLLEKHSRNVRWDRL
jgi:hypothetical protein